MRAGRSLPQRRPAPPVRLSGTGDAPLLRGWLHLAAFVAALPAGGLLVARAGAGRGVAVYAVALAGLFGVSAAYHLPPWSEAARGRMRRADHAFIYVFIAAAYTPFCLRATPGRLGEAVLAVCWAGAAAGVALTLVRFERSRWVAGPLYLTLGWVSVITLPTDARVLRPDQLGLLVAMGALYTVGAIVLAIRRPDPVPTVFGYHEVWHAMVVAAGGCYYAVLWSMTAPH